ncbi:MAG: hypothetical protein KA419_05555 [Acidobacteria bacterium]|nr:hypothetical protein [Acidobacteriota bacterium]
MKKILTIAFIAALAVTAYAAPMDTQRELRAAFEDSLWVMHSTAEALKTARTAEEAARALHGFRMDMQPLQETFRRAAQALGTAPATEAAAPERDTQGQCAEHASKTLEGAILDAVARFGNDPVFMEALLQFQAEPDPAPAGDTPVRPERPAR